MSSRFSSTSSRERICPPWIVASILPLPRMNIPSSFSVTVVSKGWGKRGTSCSMADHLKLNVNGIERVRSTSLGGNDGILLFSALLRTDSLTSGQRNDFRSGPWKGVDSKLNFFFLKGEFVLES